MSEQKDDHLDSGAIGTDQLFMILQVLERKFHELLSEPVLFELEDSLLLLHPVDFLVVIGDFLLVILAN